MHSFIMRHLLAEPIIRNVRFRNGLFVFILVSFLWPVWESLQGKYEGFVVPIMLLLNYMAFQFHWSKAVTIVLRITALVWLAFACFFTVLTFSKLF